MKMVIIKVSRSRNNLEVMDVKTAKKYIDSSIVQYGGLLHNYVQRTAPMDIVVRTIEQYQNKSKFYERCKEDIIRHTNTVGEVCNFYTPYSTGEVIRSIQVCEVEDLVEQLKNYE